MTQRLRNIRLSAKLEGIYRKDIYELPPGGLMPGVTLDKKKEGYSKIRKRALAHAFSYMNLIEAWGSGIPKLMEAMQEYGLGDPEFCDLEIGFRINLYRKEENELETEHPALIIEDKPDSKCNEKELKGSQKGAEKELKGAEKEPKRSQKGAEKELKNRAQIKNGILQRMQENPVITQRQLMEEFELTRKQIQTIIKELQENGFVERQGSARSGKWVVKKAE